MLLFLLYGPLTSSKKSKKFLCRDEKQFRNWEMRCGAKKFRDQEMRFQDQITKIAGLSHWNRSRLKLSQPTLSFGSLYIGLSGSRSDIKIKGDPNRLVATKLGLGIGLRNLRKPPWASKAHFLHVT